MPYTTTPAPLVLRAGQSRRSYRFLGPDTFGDCLLTCADTGGAFSLFDVTFGPGAGVPPHVHTAEDEIFYVLEGEFRFEIGDDVVYAGPGACLHGKRGVMHSPLNVGQAPGRMLVIATPGGFERFFDELEETGGLPATPSPDALGAMFALLGRHGMQPLGPFAPETPADAAKTVPPLLSNPCVELGDHRVWVGIPSAQTGGALVMGMVEADCEGGVPLHIHAREDEMFYVLKGRFEFEVDGRTIEAEPGDVLFAPRHLPHSWFNVGDEPGHLLGVVSPGANFEAFAQEMGKAFASCSDEREADLERLTLAGHYGIEMLPLVK